jgi:hypothetical protein
MRTHQQNFMSEDIAWASALDVRTTTEIFAKGYHELGLDGFRLEMTETCISVIDPAGKSVLLVDDVRGSIRRESGLEALMLLAKTMDLFPEVISAGYRDGRPLLLSGVTEFDLRRRYPEADHDRIRWLSIRAGLLSAVSLSNCMRRHLLSPTPPSPVMGAEGHKNASLG